MAGNGTRGAMMLVVLVAAAVLSGCISRPGTYPDPNGPRNGAGLLVDQQSGLPIPGSADTGGGGGGGM
jgi:hypothetical protein